MAVAFEINGTNRRANLRDGSLSIEKYFGVEVLTCQVLDRTTPGASAFRPTLGQSIYVEDGSDLLFGGTIVERREETLWGASGAPTMTVNTLTAKSYETLADTIVIDSLTIASEDVLVTAASLCTTYLAPLGVTNIGDLTGGPTIPSMEFDHQPLSAIFAQMTQLSGYPWRINGDLEFAFVAPGDLTGTAVSESNGYDEGFAVEQSRVIRASRLFMRTGGTGEVTHTEGRTLDGTQTTFLLNVEPSEAPTTVTENGSPLTIGAGTWTYNSTLKAIVRSSGGTNGHAISVSYPVAFPAWVRTWDSSVEAAAGTWVTASLVDAVLDASDQTDLAQCKAWGDAEIARRMDEPKVVTVRTRTKGYYPLMQVALTFADSAVSGNYLVQSVRVEVATDDNIVYVLTCIEGDTLQRNWFDFFKARPSSTSGGISVLGSGGGTVSTGTSTLPEGTTLSLGGDNLNAYTLTTSWTDAPQARPTRMGGTGMAGDWLLRVPLFQLSAGTVEARLYNQTTAATLATCTTTQTGALLSGNFAFPTDTLTAPTNVDDVLLQWRVTSGTRKCVMGQATAVKV